MSDEVDRTDFPTARRGYDRVTVDAHLARLRDEIRRLRDGGSASAAGEQVRSIVAAAEESAAEIREQAEKQAAAVRASAREDAERASAQAGRAREAAAALLAQAQALEEGLDEALRALGTPPGERDLGAGATGATATGPEPPEKSEPEPVAKGTPAAEPAPAAEGAEPAPASERASPPAGNGDAGGDVAGARLVALQAALSGRPREEVDADLEGMLDPAARASLLDEVYAKAAASS